MKMTEETRHFDVLVVGAGLAGLTAATTADYGRVYGAFFVSAPAKLTACRD